MQQQQRKGDRQPCGAGWMKRKMQHVERRVRHQGPQKEFIRGQRRHGERGRAKRRSADLESAQTAFRRRRPSTTADAAPLDMIQRKPSERGRAQGDEQ